MSKEESPDQATAEMIKDPTAGFPKGMMIGFGSAPFLTDFNEQTSKISNWEFFSGMLQMLGFGDQENYYIEGSAVLVAPGIALCATHVLEKRMEQLKAGKEHALCKGIASNGALILWHVHKVTTVDKSDLTILGLQLVSDLPPENKFLHARLTTRTPKIGDQLTICGFRAKQAAFPIEGQKIVQAEVETRLSKGAVTQVFPNGRDSCMLPGPTIEVECPTLGGMSGGPVFDSQGHLIGLLATSFEGDTVSYVSQIWPALLDDIEPVWPEGFFGNHPVCLLEMDPDLCFIDKREALSRIVNADGTTTKSYRVWGE